MVIKKQDNGSMTRKKVNIFMFTIMESRKIESTKPECISEDKQI